MTSLEKLSRLLVVFFVGALLFGSDAARAEGAIEETQGRIDYSGAKVPASPRAFYDMNLTNPATMRDMLSVINATYDLFIAKGAPAAKIKFVISLRGMSVKFVTKDFGVGTADEQTGREIRQLLTTLGTKDIRVEACEISLQWMSVDPATLLSQIVVIDNAFASSIWYQSKSYALIPIHQLP